MGRSFQYLRKKTTTKRKVNNNGRKIKRKRKARK